MASMKSVTIKIINKSKHANPSYSTPSSAGMDIRANLDKDVSLKPLERALIGTGLYIELPVGYEAQTRPRSGLAIDSGITLLNTPGTIDADYRGEIRITMINLSDKDYVVRDGDRICQMVISKHEVARWNSVDSLGDSERGTGGFGHTGKQ